MTTDFHGLPTRSLPTITCVSDYLADCRPAPRPIGSSPAPRTICWPKCPTCTGPRRSANITYAAGIAWRWRRKRWNCLTCRIMTGLIDRRRARRRAVDPPDGGRLGREQIDRDSAAARSARAHPAAGRAQRSLRTDRDHGLVDHPAAIGRSRGGAAARPGRIGNRHRPDRQLVLWSYTSWQDARLFADDDYVWIDAQPDAEEFKVGLLARGWLGYLRAGMFFLKRFDPQLDVAASRSTTRTPKCTAIKVILNWRRWRR